MSDSMDELDNRRMSLRLRFENSERKRDFLLHFGEELFATVGAAKDGFDALNNVFRKIPRREGDVAEDSGEELLNFAYGSSLHCSCTNSICRGQGRRPRESQRGR